MNASSPSSPRTRSSPAASSARYCPRPGGTDSRSSPGAHWPHGWLSGRYRKGADQPASSRAERQAERFDIASSENTAKLDAAEALAQLAEEAGLSLVQLALAFVLEHPAVTSAIIGPRTLEQLTSQLGADRVRLSQDVLDRIDKIVPPGTNLSSRDAGYHPAELTDPALRRRSRPVG